MRKQKKRKEQNLLLNSLLILTEMPKTELHIHLEGSIPINKLLEVIKKYEKNKYSSKDIVEKFKYKDFPHFLSMWIWKNTFLREYEDFEFIAQKAAEDLLKQNIKYVEMTYSPTDFRSNGLKLGRITESIRKGLDKINGIDVKLIADFCRETDVDDALNRLDQLNELKDYSVIGVNLGGNEILFPPGKWIRAFKKAGELGFYKTAHAGETAGAESVWGVLRDLEVHRIGHGTRAIEDDELIEYIYKKKIPIELCPGSNVKTGSVRNIKDHPVRKYFEKGLLISINTDDPKMFNNSLAEEYYQLIINHQFKLSEIKKLAENTIESAWCDSEKKIILKQELSAYFEEVDSSSKYEVF